MIEVKVKHVAEAFVDPLGVFCERGARSGGVVVEFIMGGACDRYPTLKFVSVESGIGWMPFLLEALDWQHLKNNLDRDYPNKLLAPEHFDVRSTEPCG